MCGSMPHFLVSARSRPPVFWLTGWGVRSGRTSGTSAHEGRRDDGGSGARRRALRRESVLGRAVRGIDRGREQIHAASRARGVDQHA